jgi:hypothetical protein
MKALNVPMSAYIVRALSARYDVAKLQSALDADYNNDGGETAKADHLAVNEKESGIQSAKAKEGKTDGAKGEFSATEVHKVVRSGVLNNPRRFTAWLVAFGKFLKANGEPSGELTADILPAHLVLWLEAKFVQDDIAKAEKAEREAANGKPGKPGNRNGGIKSVPSPAPAV